MASTSLPIDPSAIEAADLGEHRTTLEMGHEAAIEHVRETFMDAGFGIATEYSPSELLNEKVDANRDPYYVLGACNPRMADRALDASENRIGSLFPCNVVIWEDEPGHQVVYHVSIMGIAQLVGIAPDSADWQAIVDDTSEMVEDAWQNL